MAKWTKWRRLAKKGDWFDNKFDNQGPSCYELGLRVPQGKAITKVYVGHTKNEDNRMWDCGYRGSHLSKYINKALKKGFILYYRAQAKKTITQAKQMENQLLKQRYYPWNTQLC